MSGSCDSLRTNSLTSPTTSFFDIASYGSSFWKHKGKEEDCSKHPKLLENSFIIRSKSLFKEWDSCILTIYGSFLIHKKKKDEQKVKFINFDDHMHRLEVIVPGHKKYSSKYPYAFLLRANGNTAEFFCKEQDQFDNWISHLKKFCILINFTESYKTKKILGTGGYGKVYALERLADNRMFAGKFIKFSPTVSKDRQRAMIINEITILKKFNHPQIAELYEVYEMTSQVCLVMELVRGDKLFNLVTEKKTLSEPTTAFIMKQILLILSQLEAQDVIHRDIKLENLLYTYDDDDKISLKLIDFGLATFNKKRDIIRKCGTAGYIAPEILNDGAYNFKADVYSAGVIMYMCLAGRPIFHARNYEELLAKNKNGLVNYKGAAWKKLSSEAQDLIQRMLEPTPSYRISLVNALNHEWFLKNIAPEDRVDLIEHIFKVVKLDIPKEKNISKIPTSSGQLPYIQKTNAVTMSLNQKFSGSFTSTVALGIEEHKEFHSFYKGVSFDPSNSQMSISISNSSVSRNFACSITPKSVVGTIAAHTLGLPTLNSPRRPNQSLRLSLRHQKSILRYSVHVSAPESLDDLQVGHEDDGSLCCNVYEELKKNSLRFVNVLRRNSDQDIFSENEIVNDDNKVDKRRCETEAVETPRNVFKVAAVNMDVRKQIVGHKW